MGVSALGLARTIGEEVVGVQGRAAEKVEPTPMELVGPGLGDNVHHRAAVAAVFGGKAVVLELEFLNVLDRRLVREKSVAAFTAFRQSGQNSVEAELRRAVALPVGGEVGPTQCTHSAPGHRRHSRSEERQAGDLAVEERHLRDVPVGDFRAERRAHRIHERRCPHHLHRLRHLAQLQREVQIGLKAHAQNDVRPDQSFKPRCFNSNGVGSGRQGVEEVAARLIRLSRLQHLGLVIGRSHRCSRDERATRVRNRAAQLGRIGGLGRHRGWEERRHNKDRRDTRNPMPWMIHFGPSL